jgi:glycosyltransferase involved in cell wall biosynthesis
MPALVSVIMPCFNAGRMLRPALLSVTGQTYSNIEIILVDNNSTDGGAGTARDILTESGRPFTVIDCPEQGANRARNLGYTLALGDYVQWMDADDQMDRDKIAFQVAALEANPRDDIAYGDWTSHRLVRGKPDIITRMKLRQEADQLARTLAGVWYPPHLYLLRRAAADRLRDVQAWWPGRAVGTDVEYSAFAALLGLRFRHVPGARVRYNIWSSGQISGSTPYAKRVATLREIYRRLGEFVEAGHAGSPLTARHKVLLYQSWDLVWMRPGSVTVTKSSGRLFVARRVADGHQIELRPREAAIARVMARGSQPLAPFHQALALEPSVAEAAGDFVTIIRTIEMLQREGMLDVVASPGDA